MKNIILPAHHKYFIEWVLSAVLCPSNFVSTKGSIMDKAMAAQTTIKITRFVLSVNITMLSWLSTGHNYIIINTYVQSEPRFLQGWQLRFLKGDSFCEAEEVFAGADICETLFCN